MIQAPRIPSDSFAATIIYEELMFYFWLRHTLKKDILDVQNVAFYFKKNATWKYIFVSALDGSKMPRNGGIRVWTCFYFLGKMFSLNIFAARAPQGQILLLLKLDTFWKASVDIPMVQGPYLNI